MKVVLVGGWSRERILDQGTAVEQDHVDIQRYAYALGVLKAVVQQDEHASAQTEILLRSFPIELFQQVLTESDIDELLEVSPDVVGFSCRCWDVLAFLATAERIKSRAPKTRVLLGGPSASFDADRILAEHSAVDLIVRGEGEQAFVALCRNAFAEPVGIPGVTWRDQDGRVHHEPDPPAPLDLESLPSPYLTEAYVPPQPRILIEHARGCRFQCGFCAIPRIRRRLGHRSAEKFARELRWAVDRGYTSIDISSSAVNHDTEQLRAICDVLKTFERGIGVQAYLQLEPIDATQLDLLRSVHFDDLIVGIESTNDRVRKLCGKPPLDREGLEHKLDALCATGQTMNLFNILGLPGDTVESFRETVGYLDRLTKRYAGAMGVSFAWHTLLPGSGFWLRRDELGIETSQIGMASVMRTAECSWEDLVSMARTVIDCARENPAVRTDNFTHLAAADRLDPDRLRAGLPPLREPVVASQPVQAGDLGFASLVKPWQPKDQRDGWRLEYARAVKDGDDIAEIGFSYDRFGVRGNISVHVGPRNDGRPAYGRSKRYNIHYRQQPGSAVPEPSLDKLLRTVCTLIKRNEA